MKIAIMTYHNTTNYGAMFQAFALQNKLISIGVDAEILNYDNATLRKRYSVNPFADYNLKNIIKRTISLKNRFVLRRKFECFSNRYLFISKIKYDEENIYLAEEKYDKFIVGSDQVWNLKLSGNDYNYFLAFVNDKFKKNSYAASFGINDFSEEAKIEIKKFLSEFTNVSVREVDGVQLLNELKIKNVVQNIDPVFLLSKQEWNTLIKSGKRLIKEKYILVYEMTYTPNLIKFAKKTAEKNNLKVVFVSGSNRKVRGFINKNNLSPNDFLNCLNDAECVITSSFHGVALSIIFNKEFYFDLSANLVNSSSRLTSLVNLLEIKGRNISQDDISYQKIDYDKVNVLIKDEILKSEKYLFNVVKGYNVNENKKI